MQWFLVTKASEDILAAAVSEVSRMAHDTNETEESFEQRLRRRALRCGSAFNERQVISTYVKGLQPAVRHIVQNTVGYNLRAFKSIRSTAQSYVQSLREAQKQQRVTRHPSHHQREHSSLVFQGAPQHPSVSSISGDSAFLLAEGRPHSSKSSYRLSFGYSL